jgi:kynurenine formamidase
MLNTIKFAVLIVFICSIQVYGIQAAETSSPSQKSEHQVGVSPWGPDDELGRLNMITEDSVAATMSMIKPGKSYDLSVDFSNGMPSFFSGAEPRYGYWLVHSPHGTIVDNALGAGAAPTELITLTGDAVTIYTHMGTHIDALNHFGLHGKIYNQFEASRYLGDAGWQKSGAETIPPLIARGVLIDVAAAKKMEVLAPSHRISAEDLQEALKLQETALQKGDIVLVRTGQMKHFSDAQKYMNNAPGLSLGAAKFLVESEAMIVGADNLTFEMFPSEVEGNPVPVHTYLLAQHGVPIIELAYLEELSKDKIYTFVFIGASIKFKGASAAPIRPIAIPMK